MLPGRGKRWACFLLRLGCLRGGVPADLVCVDAFRGGALRQIPLFVCLHTAEIAQVTLLASNPVLSNTVRCLLIFLVLVGICSLSIKCVFVSSLRCSTRHVGFHYLSCFLLT
jgi:hypothetical protein